MKAQQPLCPHAGFTLIEVMIALVILSIGILALAKLQISAIQGNTLSQNMTTAVSLAEQRVEQLKNTPYTDIKSESPPVNIDPNTAQVTAAVTKWTRQVTVTDGSPLTNTKTVSVLVTWTDKAKTHTVPITVIIARPLGG